MPMKLFNYKIKGMEKFSIDHKTRGFEKWYIENNKENLRADEAVCEFIDNPFGVAGVRNINVSINENGSDNIIISNDGKQMTEEQMKAYCSDVKYHATTPDVKGVSLKGKGSKMAAAKLIKCENGQSGYLHILSYCKGETFIRKATIKFCENPTDGAFAWDYTVVDVKDKGKLPCGIDTRTLTRTGGTTFVLENTEKLTEGDISLIKQTVSETYGAITRDKKITVTINGETVIYEDFLRLGKAGTRINSEGWFRVKTHEGDKNGIIYNMSAMTATNNTTGEKVHYKILQVYISRSAETKYHDINRGSNQRVGIYSLINGRMMDVGGNVQRHFRRGAFAAGNTGGGDRCRLAIIMDSEEAAHMFKVGSNKSRGMYDLALNKNINAPNDGTAETWTLENGKSPYEDIFNKMHQLYNINKAERYECPKKGKKFNLLSDNKITELFNKIEKFTFSTSKKHKVKILKEITRGNAYGSLDEILNRYALSKRDIDDVNFTYADLKNNTRMKMENIMAHIERRIQNLIKYDNNEAMQTRSA